MRNLRALIGTQGAVLLCSTLIAGSAQAAALSGSGPNVLIPTVNPGAPLSQARTLSSVVTGTSFTGSWTSPVFPAWIGSYSANGPVPAGTTNPTGLTRYDFTSLPNGFLPTGTFFFFGDVDGGSTTTEQYELQAFGTTGGAITTPWLDEAIGVIGTGTGTAGAILAINMPSWAFNTSTGIYTFDGATVGGGNPTIGFFLPSNVNITLLNVSRFSAFENFALYAPIPAPGAAVVLGAGMICAVRRRRVM